MRADKQGERRKRRLRYREKEKTDIKREKRKIQRQIYRG